MRKYPGNVKDSSGSSDSVVPVALIGYYGEDGEPGATAIPTAAKLLPSGIAPLSGNAVATGVVGPFTPKLGRAIWLALSGTWTGTVTVKRSADGGTTKLPLTAGGQPWAVFTANAYEQIVEETEDGATYYLDVTLASGTLTYRVSQ